MNIKNDKKSKVERIKEIWKMDVSIQKRVEIILSKFNLLKRLKSTYEYRKRNEYLLKNGEKILSKIDDIFKEAKIDYWLDYGTLLGCIRDKNFIEYDDDIDLGVIYPIEEKKYENMVRLFIKKGFIRKRIVLINDRLAIEKFQFEKVTVDIFYYTLSNFTKEIETFTGIEKDDGKTEIWSCKNIYSGIMRQKFKNIEVNVMKDSDLYLKNYYGINYQEKIKNFDWTKLENYRLTNYKYERIFFDKNKGKKE